ncbi:hypothetical protein [Pedobacter kyonggii]|uniref:Uncharacterized protein n=1 Tax=Pedobacter kyonggii TaxID=1926871 RepID=A0A4Q9H3I4_9SPHI|nr:hypothetical protein [Pedobacter kyonggii]TBO35934.1 hypothetical protein EYS08_25425 [Pedobacter kyonggii]
MSPDANNFPAIRSKTSKSWTSFINGLGLIFCVLTPLLTVLMAIMVCNSTHINIEIKALIVVIALFAVWFFVWLLVATIKEKSKNKITHVVVDRNGLHHYTDNEELIKTMPYNLLMPGGENGKYDVFINLRVGTDLDPDLSVYLFDEKSNKTVTRAVLLECDLVITNGNLLLAHFIKGIIIFRPDLKIDPNVLGLYKLKEFEPTH